jgi:hypothetical protein
MEMILGKPTEPNLADLALTLDQMPTDRLQNAANALEHYEAETDEWMADWMSEAEDEGVEFEEDDAYWAAFDAFCDEFQPAILKQYGVTEDDFGLLMQTSHPIWKAISELMKNDRNRDIFIRMCSRL